MRYFKAMVYAPKRITIIILAPARLPWSRFSGAFFTMTIYLILVIHMGMGKDEEGGRSFFKIMKKYLLIFQNFIFIIYIAPKYF